MILEVQKSETSGVVRIPGSKSHTIRALFIASLSGGQCEILDPLLSDDTLSAVEVCKAFGADIRSLPGKFVVTGFGGSPRTPENVIDVGNSGTTLRIGMATAGLAEGCSVFTGDEQIRKRPLGPLIEAMNSLGAEVFTTRGNSSAPVVVRGKMKGGFADLDAVTSQYLTALLINTPLLPKDTEILVTRLNEKPYVDMTLWWLDKMGIEYENDGYKTFKIKGRQKYPPFCQRIPGDFSSATFFMVQAAVSGGEFRLQNLDMTDPQGDKMVLAYLKQMGAAVETAGEEIVIRGGKLKGIEIDMNATPDALPAMAVAACFAEGETRLVNVPQARLKETDRISVMRIELAKMGADITELPDGLVIRKSPLMGCAVHGHGDHRVDMALAVAGLNAEGRTVIDTAEAVNVTFPEFADLMKKCGGKLKMQKGG